MNTKLETKDKRKKQKPTPNKNKQKGRYYLGFCSKGDPQKVIDIVYEKVNEYDLSKLIPLLRVEKKDKQNKRGEFYFFLAIDKVDNPQFEKKYQDFKDKILVLPYFHRQAVKGLSQFTYEQIKPMVGNNHYLEDYTNPIPYQKNQEKDIEINHFTCDFTPAYLVDDSQEKNYQNLLYWLSAIGECSWQSFKQTCDLLKLENPQRILRRLKLLGHVKTSSNGKKCFVNLPTIVKFDADANSEQEKLILCGQRNEKLISTLAKYAEIKYLSQPLKNAPYTIELEFNRSLDIHNIIQEIKQENSLIIYYSDLAICQLVEKLPNLEQWFDNLPTLQGIVTSLYDWKYLINNDFIECLNPDKTGMYQMFKCRRENLIDDINFFEKKPIKTVFYDQDKQCFKQGDWYGLRLRNFKPKLN